MEKSSGKFVQSEAQIWITRQSNNTRKRETFSRVRIRSHLTFQIDILVVKSHMNEQAELYN